MFLKEIKEIKEFDFFDNKYIITIQQLNCNGMVWNSMDTKGIIVFFSNNKRNYYYLTLLKKCMKYYHSCSGYDTDVIEKDIKINITITKENNIYYYDNIKEEELIILLENYKEKYHLEINQNCKEKPRKLSDIFHYVKDCNNCYDYKKDE